MPPRKRQQLPPAFQTVSLHPPSPPPSPPPPSLADVDDLLMEILLRLPAKSVNRFKCVCKKWRTLISSDYFCHHHTLRRPKLQPSFLLRTYFRVFFYLNPINGEKKMIPYSLSVPIIFHHYYLIVQACNGLMLLKLSHIKINYYIYNPTTRQSREIISTHDKNEHPRVAAIGLAFDPSKSPYYKIVCIRSIGEAADSDLYTTCYQIEVYDSESRAWKLSLEPVLDNTPIHTFGTYWNNAIYWSFSNGESHYYRWFDIGKNELKTFPFPQTPPDFDESNHDSFNSYLQESDGHLYHFELFRIWLENEGTYDKESVIVLVWELVGDEDSQWIFKYDHRLPSTADCKSYIWRSRSMGVSGSGSGSGSDGDGTCSLLTYGWAGKMRSYSFLDKSYEDFLDFTTQPWYQQDNYNRLNVKCFHFGEVLALV